MFTNSCDVGGPRTISLSSAFTFLRSPPLPVAMFNKRVDLGLIGFTSFREKQFNLRHLSEGLPMFLFEVFTVSNDLNVSVPILKPVFVFHYNQAAFFSPWREDTRVQHNESCELKWVDMAFRVPSIVVLAGKCKSS